MSKASATYGGIAIFILGVVLVALKFAGVGVIAGLSWWLVTFPLWIGFALIAASAIGALLLIGLIAFLVR